MKVSVGKDNTNFRDKEVNTIEELCEVITSTPYSLSTFRDGQRRAANFKSAEMVGLDFDGGYSIEQAAKDFADYKHIIAPSRNHRKEKNGVIADRFRVVLFTEKPITDPRDFKATYAELLRKFPKADAACNDPSRQFYASTEVAFTGKGKSIPVVKAPEQKLVERVDNTTKGTLSKETHEFIIWGAPEGTWNHHLFKAAKDIQQQNYTVEEAVELLRRATLDFQGDLDDNDIATIESAYREPAKYEPRVPESPFTFENLEDFMSRKLDMNWLVQDLLSAGGFSLWYGQPKSGKSTLCRQLAASISRGTPFLGRKVKPGRVLYMAFEEQPDVLQAQLKKQGVTKDDDILIHVGPMHTADPFMALDDALAHYRPAMVVLDTLFLFTTCDINSYTEVNALLTKLRNIGRKHGTHIAAVHHSNKHDGILGSTAIFGAVDNALGLRSRGIKRVLNTRQRGGQAFIGQYLDFDKSTETYALGEGTDEF